jgi:hypothetical protein
MSRSGWRYILATVGLLALVALGTVTYHLYDASQQRHANYSYQPAGKSRLLKLMPAETVPEGYKPHCQNPQSNEDADLCAQWAAVEQVAEANRMGSLNLRFAIASLWAAIIGTGLLVWTLIETRDTARRQLRAYLVFNEVVYNHEKKDFKIQVEWVNSGQTPALHADAFATWKLTSEPLPDDFDFPDTEPRDDDGPATIGPNKSIMGTSSEYLLPETILEIARGQRRFYVWGAVEYTDIFNVRRRTETAASMQVELLDDDGSIVMRWNSIRRHNGVDGECLRPPSHKRQK